MLTRLAIGAVMLAVASGCDTQLYLCNLTGEPASFEVSEFFLGSPTEGRVLIEPCECGLVALIPRGPETPGVHIEAYDDEGNPIYDGVFVELPEEIPTSEGNVYIPFHGTLETPVGRFDPPACPGAPAALTLCNESDQAVHILLGNEAVRPATLLQPGECRNLSTLLPSPGVFSVYDEESEALGFVELPFENGDRIVWDGETLTNTGGGGNDLMVSVMLCNAHLEGEPAPVHLLLPGESMSDATLVEPGGCRTGQVPLGEPATVLVQHPVAGVLGECVLNSPQGGAHAYWDGLTLDCSDGPE